MRIQLDALLVVEMLIVRPRRLRSFLGLLIEESLSAVAWLLGEQQSRPH
jgi:hypothetical protein